MLGIATISTQNDYDLLKYYKPERIYPSKRKLIKESKRNFLKFCLLHKSEQTEM